LTKDGFSPIVHLVNRFPKGKQRMKKCFKDFILETVNELVPVSITFRTIKGRMVRTDNK
jgi:hypothetical protein